MSASVKWNVPSLRPDEPVHLPFSHGYARFAVQVARKSYRERTRSYAWTGEKRGREGGREREKEIARESQMEM